MNILDFLKLDGILLTGKTRSEYAGPCPFCGTGKDRFRVWPHHTVRGVASGGRYWCRQCGKSGDAIQYLREKRGTSFIKACEMIGRNVDRHRHGRRSDRQSRGWRPKEAVTPGEAWQTSARVFQRESAERLLMQETPGRAFLDRRGLKAATIQAGGLGWNPTDLYFDRQAWGIADETMQDRKAKRLWIPRGLVIPCMSGEKIIRLRIRSPSGDPRYVIIPGSSSSPLKAGEDTGAAVIVESELDAMLLCQEAGDLALMIALGSVAIRPDTNTHARLKRAKIILNALDADQSGAKEAWGFWIATYGRKVKRWPVPTGKDPGEAYQAGIDLREWVEAGADGILQKEQ